MLLLKQENFVIFTGTINTILFLSLPRSVKYLFSSCLHFVFVFGVFAYRELVYRLLKLNADLESFENDIDVLYNEVRTFSIIMNMEHC